MALRNIRHDGDPLLRKISKEVKEVTPRVKELVEDMIETMYHANGVGLAAPQIGVLKRVMVVDIEDEENRNPMAFINPVIFYEEGLDRDQEGCLSVPGVAGLVNRPQKIKVRALNKDGEEFELEAEDFLARAICHEVDHLEGILFTDKEDYERLTEEDLKRMYEENEDEEEEYEEDDSSVGKEKSKSYKKSKGIK